MKKNASADISLVRKINQRMVLDAIYDSENTSRTELAARLQMSKPAIADNLAHLIELGIVSEVGEGESAAGGGRKPVLLAFNKDFRQVLSIDLNLLSPVIVLSNLSGEVAERMQIRIAPDDDACGVLHCAVADIMKRRGLAPDDVVSVSIAAPGVYDDHSRPQSVNPGYGGIRWNNVDFRDVFSEFGRVRVMNDIKAAALGEWRAGAGSAADGMLYVSCGVGLGAGLVLDGRLYEGSHFAAGEIYNFTDITKRAQGRTLESEVCIRGLIENIRDRIVAGGRSAIEPNGVTFDEIVAAYKNGDEVAVAAVAHVCDELSMVIFNIINLLDLDRVVFGGEYSVFAPALFSAFQERYAGVSRIVPAFRAARLGAMAGIEGLIYTARDAFFNEICGSAEAD